MNFKKYGIMGGTFDPIHFGHLVVANEVLAKYKLDRIIFVPTGNPPHKSITGLTYAYHRYMMVEFATMTNPKFYVSNIEVEREGVSYTVDTIRELKYKYNDIELYFITGTDAVLDLPTWKNTEEILKLCKFIAVDRPGYVIDNYKQKINKIMDEYGGSIETVKAPQLKISSTDIRARIDNNRPVKYLLPENVEQYIFKNELYKNERR